ncbi:MAG: ATP-binding cassette domain-containing protein [Candidatus Hydrogenedentota bacterium]
MNLLEMECVSFLRQTNPIIDDLSWKIAPGEHWTLLGANGSGKTTLLKLLTAYEWASSGTIEVLGKRYGECHVGLHRRHMGWVSASLQRQLPGRDTAVRIVASGLEASFGWYGEWNDEVEAESREALDRLGVGHLWERTYETLSQGEQKRVQIARAIVHRPQLLILDEPCEGLDPVSRQNFLRDLAGYVVGDDAPSIIYVTHHIEEIGPWMTHGLVLKDGKSLVAGPIESIMTSDLLGEAFGEDCTVARTNGRYTMRLSY